MTVDCHIHMVLDGENWKSAIDRHRPQPEEELIRGRLKDYQQRGYTYLRDGGDRWGVGKRAAELAAEYGICYRTPLAPLCKKGHYGGFIGENFENIGEFRQKVAEHRKNGADFIKIMISGLMDFDRFGQLSEPGLEKKEIQEMIHIAHGEGFSVMAHANGAAAVEAASEAGVDSVEHGAYLQEDTLWVMKEMGTVWVPTLSAIGNLLGKGRFCDDALEKILENSMENIRRFTAMGGLIACGSDAGAWAVPHGGDTEENWLLQATDQQTLCRGNEEIQRKF